ncbi:MAG: shikimate dehydrogenase family protein [Marinifilaceae bacterium]
MKTYGLIGVRLDYSFSRAYFTEKFTKEHIKAQYVNFELKTIAELDVIIRKEPTLCGFNVTIPYKEQIIPMLKSLTPAARAIGAVNCVKVTRTQNGIELEGDNTDCIGFKISLLELLAGKVPIKAYILGTGGAAKAVAYVLEQMNIPYQYVSRKAKGNNIDYTMLRMQMHPGILIVNTTPLGTWPNVESCPDINYEALTNQDFLYDLTYNPSTTRFMSNGAMHGARVMNGQQMLEQQAEAAWKFWNNNL